MPTYIFKIKETSEVVEYVMKMSEYDEFVSKNLHLERFINIVPHIADPVTIGVTKKDSGFKAVLENIHRRTPGSTLNRSSSQI